ncbi:MAG: hypothetical protein A3F11_11190 [Gammaproteobacteria bacterium RIFCSPHIGHO2_12_FULL_37_14]|nr:MAG: hypothetical protein A3F11_11190 [Gammaproteobacteria bacterium RIFCSPHIGHO2_12_FULL_37_14]
MAIMPLINSLGNIFGLTLMIVLLFALGNSVQIISNLTSIFILKIFKLNLKFSVKALLLISFIFLLGLVGFVFLISIFKNPNMLGGFNGLILAFTFLIWSFFLWLIVFAFLKKKYDYRQRGQYIFATLSSIISSIIWAFLIAKLGGYIAFAALPLLPIAIMLLVIQHRISK